MDSLTTILSSRIIREAIAPLNSKDRANVLIIDDSMYERNRSKKLELLTKVYDHVKHAYKYGFRMLTLGWSDGCTFLPVNSILLSTDNKKNRINEAATVDKRTDINLDEKEIIRLYEKRWDIEVFFKVCKSYLHLSKECKSMSNDAMSDITLIQTFQLMLQIFKTMLSDHIDISDEKIAELVEAFMDAIPPLLKSKLQAA